MPLGRREWLLFLLRVGFSPDFGEKLECGTRVWKRQNNPHAFGICSIRSIWLQVPSFPVLAPACTAVMFGLLLSTLSRLTHILYAVLDGSNFRGTRGKQNTPEGGEGGPIFPRPSRSFEFPRLDRRVLGRRSRGANGAPRRAMPGKRRGPPKKAGICTAR